MNDDNLEFRTFLRNKREEAKLSIRKLAELSGVSHSYLASVENGSRGIPSQVVLGKIANALQVNYLTFLQKAGYINQEFAERISEAEKLVGDSLEGNNYTDYILKSDDSFLLLETKNANDLGADLIRIRNNSAGCKLETIKIPVYSGNLLRNFPKNKIVEYETIIKDEGKDFFIYLVKGELLKGFEINDGHRLTIQKGTNLKDGKIHLVVLNKEDTAILMKVYSDNDKYILLPGKLNAPPRICMNGEFEIIGQVKKAEYDL